MSWTDANVGRVLDAFENTQLAEADDYVLVVWGDHGWHLGDNVSTKDLASNSPTTTFPAES